MTAPGVCRAEAALSKWVKIPPDWSQYSGQRLTQSWKTFPSDVPGMTGAGRLGMKNHQI